MCLRTIAFNTTLLLALLLSESVQAQPTKHRVLIMECINRSTGGIDEQAILVTDSLYKNLSALSREVFEAIPKQTVLNSARRLKINKDQTRSFTVTDYYRVAGELKPDIILESQIAVATPEKNRPVKAGIVIQFHDVALGEIIGSALVYTTAKTALAALENVTKQAIRKATTNLYLTAKVLRIVDEIIVLSCGKKDGIRKGEEFALVSESEGKNTKVGRVRIHKLLTTESAANIVDFDKNFRGATKAIRVSKRRIHLQY